MRNQHQRKTTHYWDPFIAGALLGVLLFLAFLLTGHGLGSSGGVNRMLVAIEDLVIPRHVDTTPYLAAMAGGPDGATTESLAASLGVFAAVGATQLTRMRCGASSSAIVWVNWMTPASWQPCSASCCSRCSPPSVRSRHSRRGPSARSSPDATGGAPPPDTTAPSTGSSSAARYGAIRGSSSVRARRMILLVLMDKLVYVF